MTFDGKTKKHRSSNEKLKRGHKKIDEIKYKAAKKTTAIAKAKKSKTKGKEHTNTIEINQTFITNGQCGE